MPAEPPRLSWHSYGDGDGNDGTSDGDGSDKDCLGQPHGCSQQQRFPYEPIARDFPLLPPTSPRDETCQVNLVAVLAGFRGRLKGFPLPAPCLWLPRSSTKYISVKTNIAVTLLADAD